MSGQIAGMNKKQTASEIIEEMFAQYNEIINVLEMEKAYEDRFYFFRPRFNTLNG